MCLDYGSCSVPEAGDRPIELLRVVGARKETLSPRRLTARHLKLVNRS
jgi:hypothetical protein